VTGIGGLDHVGRNGADCVAALFVESFGRHGGDFVVGIEVVFLFENGVIFGVAIVGIAVVRRKPEVL
jgi:hypothetical protein